MKLMIKMLSLVLALALMLCLGACTGNTDPEQTTEPSQTETGAETSETLGTGNNDATSATVSWDETTEGYKVTLLDMDEDPVKDAWIRMRLADGTILHCLTDSSGVAIFDAPEGDYQVSVVAASDDYEFSANDIHTFEAGSKELTVHIVCTRIKV